MPRLDQPRADHREAVLRFERQNTHHQELLAEQEAGSSAIPGRLDPAGAMTDMDERHDPAD